jgi:hypothetical protein
MHLFQKVAYALGKPCSDLYYMGSQKGFVKLDSDNEWIITDPLAFQAYLVSLKLPAEYGRSIELLVSYCDALLECKETG